MDKADWSFDKAGHFTPFCSAYSTNAQQLEQPDRPVEDFIALMQRSVGSSSRDGSPESLAQSSQSEIPADWFLNLHAIARRLERQ